MRWHRALPSSKALAKWRSWHFWSHHLSLIVKHSECTLAGGRKGDSSRVCSGHFEWLRGRAQGGSGHSRRRRGPCWRCFAQTSPLLCGKSHWVFFVRPLHWRCSGGRMQASGLIEGRSGSFVSTAGRLGLAAIFSPSRLPQWTSACAWLVRKKGTWCRL